MVSNPYDPGPSTPVNPGTAADLGTEGSSVSGDPYSGPQQPTGFDYPSDPPTESSTGGGDQSKTDVAKQEAGAVKDTAVEAGKNVAGTAKEQAASVAAEAGQQAKNLLGNVRSELGGQASSQQQRLGDTVHGWAKELGSMAANSEHSGLMSDLAQQAAHKGGEIAHWLQNREPADLLDDVRSFARRRPVTFLVICGLAGVAAGRLTRGAVAANTSLDSKPSQSSLTSSTEGYGRSGEGFAALPSSAAVEDYGVPGGTVTAGGYAAGTSGGYAGGTSGGYAGSADTGYATGGSGGAYAGSTEGGYPVGTAGAYTDTAFGANPTAYPEAAYPPAVPNDPMVGGDQTGQDVR